MSWRNDRAKDLRDDALLGARAHGSQPAALRARLDAAAAGGREARFDLKKGEQTAQAYENAVNVN